MQRLGGRKELDMFVGEIEWQPARPEDKAGEQDMINTGNTNRVTSLGAQPAAPKCLDLTVRTMASHRRVLQAGHDLIWFPS